MANQDTILTIKTMVDQSGLQQGIKQVESTTEKLNSSNELSVKVKTSLDNLADAKSMSDYKKSLKDLKGLMLEIGDSSSSEYKKITQAIGETQDKIGDMNTVLKGTSGEPVENLRNSFTGLGQSLTSLDFNTAKAQFGNLTSAAKKLTGELFGGFNAMKSYKTAMEGGKTSTEALSISTKGFGKALAATGIGLIVIAVAALIANFDTLKKSGGLVGVVMSKIGDIVSTVTEKLKKLGDWLGLTDFKQQESANLTLSNLESTKKAISDRYDHEIAMAAASGKSTTALEAKKADELIHINKRLLHQIGDDDEDAKQQLVTENKKLQQEKEVMYAKDAKAHSDAENAKTTKAIEESKRASERAEEESKRKAEILDKQLIDEATARNESDLQATAHRETELDIQNEFNITQQELDDEYNRIYLEGKAKTAQDVYAIIRKGYEDRYALQIKETQDQQAANEQLEDNAITQLGIQERHRKSQQEVDDKYEEIYKSGKAKTAKEIYEIIDKQYTDEEKRAAIAAMKKKEQREQEIAVAMSVLNSASNILNAMSTFEDAKLANKTKNLKKGSKEEQKYAKESFERQKKMQIAMAVVSGIQGAISALVGMITTIPGPVGITMGAVAAASVALSTAANIAKIKSTQFGGSVQSPDTGGGGGGGGSLPPAPPNTIGLGEEKLSLQRRESNFQKVYVTESDIRKTTGKVEVIEDRALLR